MEKTIEKKNTEKFLFHEEKTLQFIYLKYLYFAFSMINAVNVTIIQQIKTYE